RRSGVLSTYVSGVGGVGVQQQGQVLAVGRQGLFDLRDGGHGDLKVAAGGVDGTLGLVGAVHAQAAHVVVAVTHRQVLDHLVAALPFEVHVDVGHLGARRVQEPLEQQPAFDRVDPDDAKCVGDG